MGQAKSRGTQAERIAQAQAKIAATRPEKLVCNGWRLCENSPAVYAKQVADALNHSG